jgi:hypothetical protein
MHSTTPVYEINPVHDRLGLIRDQRRESTRLAEARRSVAITGAAVRRGLPRTMAALGFHRDIGPHALHFLHMHEPILEHRLGNHGYTIRPRRWHSSP